MITEAKIKQIYEQLRTPFKYGAVIKQQGNYYDSPVVFKNNNVFYMTCVEIDSNCTYGYKTKLFRSNDLVHFEEVGYILTESNDWDSVQTGGYAQLIDAEFGGSNTIHRVDGKYLFAYVGGNKKGYETDPLSMGFAYCTDVDDLLTYRKFPNPVFTGKDADARFGEQLTIYKACTFIDEKQVLGHKYVMLYNAKSESMKESIYLAVSDDGIHYKRFLDSAIVSAYDIDAENINGDPQIVVMDGLYVMIYFRYENGEAYNTFAVSENLVDWVQWKGQPLMIKEFEWENVFAHKQWFIKENGIVYQYYCAVNDKNERFIALATSQEL